MNLYLDIETLPTESPEVIAEIAAGVLPPGNISKAETIAAWMAEKKPGLVDEAVRKTAFDGGLGRLVCIGYAFEGEKTTHHLAPSAADEPTALQAFYEAVSAAARLQYHGGETRTGITVCGHNVTWDLRFLFQRSAVHGIRPPAALIKAMQAKPWSVEIADTMALWNPNPQGRVSLDKLCRALGVTSSKGEMDGSKVYDFYKAGRLAEIATYCMGDVHATRAIHKRLTFNA